MKTRATPGVVLALAAAALLAVTACFSGCRGRDKGGKPIAVATIFAYYDALRTIAGPDMDCRILLPAKVSPHEYEPTVADRAAVVRAALIVKNGLLIDPWVDKMAANNKSAKIVDVSKVVKARGIQPLRTQEISLASQPQAAEHEDVSAGNPHIWLDPRVQAMAAEAIRDALIEIDPAHKDGYTARAKAYLRELAALDADFARAASKFKQKEFIGFHPAYDYLANRYGLKQLAAVEELPGQGPSPAQQKKIIELIRERNVKVIFTESALPEREARPIVDQTGVKTAVLQPLETYESLDDTYVSLMRKNLRALEEALK